MARPRKLLSDKQTDTITISTTIVGKQAIRLAAKTAGLSVSGYIGQILFSKDAVRNQRSYRRAEVVVALNSAANQLEVIAQAGQDHCPDSKAFDVAVTLLRVERLLVAVAGGSTGNKPTREFGDQFDRDPGDSSC